MKRMWGNNDNFDVIRRGGLYVQKEPGNLGNHEIIERRKNHEIQCRDHLKALLSYGLRHGLPNLSHDEIKQRLRAL